MVCGWERNKYIFCRIFHLRKTYGMKMRFEVGALGCCVCEIQRMGMSTVKWKIWKKNRREGGTRVENNLFKVSKAARSHHTTLYSIYSESWTKISKREWRQNYADKGEKNVKRKRIVSCLQADLENTERKRRKKKFANISLCAQDSGGGGGEHCCINFTQEGAIYGKGFFLRARHEIKREGENSSQHSKISVSWKYMKYHSIIHSEVYIHSIYEFD